MVTMSKLFYFIIGNSMGAFIAQNYNIPNIKVWALSIISVLKTLEEKSRKT